jgi:hypothetical protein
MTATVCCTCFSGFTVYNTQSCIVLLRFSLVLLKTKEVKEWIQHFFSSNIQNTKIPVYIENETAKYSPFFGSFWGKSGANLVEGFWGTDFLKLRRQKICVSCYVILHYFYDPLFNIVLFPRYYPRDENEFGIPYVILKKESCLSNGSSSNGKHH